MKRNINYCLSSRVLVMFNLTNFCNQSCKHCVANSGCEKKEHLDYNKLVEVLKDLSACTNNNAHISLVGGEATLWPDFYRLLENEHFKNVKYKMLYTNATAINDKDIEKIKNADFYEVRVSIDSNISSSHDDLRGIGTFDRTIKYAKKMIEQGIPVTSAMVLKKNNISHIDEIIKFLEDFGIQYVHLLPFYSGGDEKIKKLYKIEPEVLSEFFRNLKAIYPMDNNESVCVKGTSYFKINYDGECVLQQNRNKIYLGNINDTCFKELYNKALDITNLTIVNCEECPYYADAILCRNMHKYCVYNFNFRKIDNLN